MIAYKITNLVNGKGYIGITSQSIARRLASHRSLARSGDGRTLYRAMRKYGMQNFLIEQIGSAFDFEELKKVEQQLIKENETYAAYGKGYNETFGGDGVIGVRFTNEQKARMSASRKGRVASEETRATLSAIRTGKSLSQETKEKISAALSGRKRPPEVGAKISAIQSGKKQSPQSNIKRSMALKGKPRSEETKRKISESHKRKKDQHYVENCNR